MLRLGAARFAARLRALVQRNQLVVVGSGLGVEPIIQAAPGELGKGRLRPTTIGVEIGIGLFE